MRYAEHQQVAGTVATPAFAAPPKAPVDTAKIEELWRARPPTRVRPGTLRRSALMKPSYFITLVAATAWGCASRSAVTYSEPALGPTSAGESACAYVTSFGGEDLCGLHVPNGRSLGCVRTGAKPHGVALSTDGARVYVSNEGSDSVTVVDAATMKSVGEVRVGHEPNQVALSPASDRLWVTNHADSTVSVVDTSRLAVERTIPVGRAPHVITTNAARNFAIVTSEGDDALDIFDLGTFERVSHVPVFGFPRVLAVPPAGDTAFLTVRWLNGALVVDLSGKGPRDRIALGEPKFAAEGKDAHGIALTPDARTILITTQMTDELTFIDPQTLSVLGKLLVGHNPNWIGVTADGRYAVVSTTDDDSASIVDLSARKVAAVAHVGHQPKRLAVGRCPAGAS